MLYLFIGLIGFLISYIMFFPSLKLSKIMGAIDVPSNRKVHSIPTARAGGLSFFVAFSLCLLISSVDISLKIPLIFGSTIIFLVGFLDDTVTLSPFIKLSGQSLSLAFYHFSSELLGYNPSVSEAILTSIWIIFITNATNIIDGLDGLAGGVCMSQALSLSVIALILGDLDIFLCLFALLGAILGFMPRNFPKAKIFMGDCGALFLGFTLGVLSSRMSFQSHSVTAVIATLIVFRVPIYDTKSSIVRRLIKGKNPFRADRGHFHHHLLRRGFTRECATLLLITVSLLFGFIGILVMMTYN